MIETGNSDEQYLTCPKCGHKYTVHHDYCREPLDIEYALVRHKCKSCVYYGRYKNSRLSATVMDCPKCGEMCRNLKDTDIIEITVTRRKRQKRTPRSALKGLPDYCECCGFTEDLQVHHKDWNHINNDPTNLQMLCKYCHVQARNLGKPLFEELLKRVKSNPSDMLELRNQAENFYHEYASRRNKRKKL